MNSENRSPRREFLHEIFVARLRRTVHENATKLEVERSDKAKQRAVGMSAHNSTLLNFIVTMMKAVIFASLFAGAAAFAPVAQKSASTALNMAFEDELGAQPPLGFFDRTYCIALANGEHFF
jgi:hypothetical protein